MNKKLVPIIIVVLIVVGVGITILVNSGNVATTDNSIPVTREALPTRVAATSTPAPVPTVVDFKVKISRVSDIDFGITSEYGDTYFPKTPEWKIFIRKNGVVTPATFNDLKVGQGVTIENLVPGKSADFIIEQ